jgi:hypothetical protein
MGIHPTDMQSLSDMLGTDILSPEFIAEYRVNLKMFHLGGGAGPLGTLHLVSLCRMFDMGPPSSQPVQTNDWSRLEKGAAILVGQKQAKFMGMVDMGKIAYVLNGESTILECEVKYAVLDESSKID